MAELETLGTVIAVNTQWWLKVNTKPVRLGAADGAVFPHVILVRYRVGERDYTRRKWLGPGTRPPAVGSRVRVRYREEKPRRALILCGAGPTLPDVTQ